MSKSTAARVRYSRLLVQSTSADPTNAAAASESCVTVVIAMGYSAASAHIMTYLALDDAEPCWQTGSVKILPTRTLLTNAGHAKSKDIHTSALTVAARIFPGRLPQSIRLLNLLMHCIHCSSLMLLSCTASVPATHRVPFLWLTKDDDLLLVFLFALLCFQECLKALSKCTTVENL